MSSQILRVESNIWWPTVMVVLETRKIPSSRYESPTYLHAMNLTSSSTVVLSPLFVEPRAAILHVFVLTHADLPPRQCSLLSDTSARCIVVWEIFDHCRYWIVSSVEVLLNHSNVDIWSMSRRPKSEPQAHSAVHARACITSPSSFHILSSSDNTIFLNLPLRAGFQMWSIHGRRCQLRLCVSPNHCHSNTYSHCRMCCQSSI